VKFRIIFTVATFTHNIFHHCVPYLSNLVTFCSSDPHRRQLRSSTVRSAMVSRTRTQFGRRGFSVCAPEIWNITRPTDPRLIDSHAAFRCALKTHLFNTALIAIVLTLFCNARSIGFSVRPGTRTFTVYMYIMYRRTCAGVFCLFGRTRDYIAKSRRPVHAR